MKNKKSIWQILKPIKNEVKQKIWFEYCPSVCFKGVTFGKRRKILFFEEQQLVLYRDDINNESYLQWISNSLLFNREN